MPKLIALRSLCGDYGRVQEGQVFETDDLSAESLESRGLAQRYRKPNGFLTKMFAPTENKMLRPDEMKVEAPVVTSEPPTVQTTDARRTARRR